MQVQIKNDSIMCKASSPAMSAVVTASEPHGLVKSDKYETVTTWDDLTNIWDSYTNPWDYWLLASIGSDINVSLKKEEVQQIKIS